MKLLTLKTVQVEDWVIKCSLVKGGILIVMLNTHTDECVIRYFKSEREANIFVNDQCYKTI
jgi:hypothetical protein